MLNRVLVLALAVAILAPMSLPVAASVAASAQTMKTLIIEIDPSSFNPSKVKALDGQAIYFASTANVAIIRVPSAATGLVKHLPGVIHVSEDSLVTIYKPGNGKGKPQPTQPSQQLPWGVDYVDAEQVWAVYGVKGAADSNNYGERDIEVAIIDTDIDKDHPDLYKNIAWCISVLNGRLSKKCGDQNGHGTHVAGTIAALDNDIGVVGVAPDVEIYMIKAFGPSGTARMSDLIMAVDQAIKGPDGVVDSDGDGVVAGDPDDDAPEVISMSFGGGGDVLEFHDVLASAYNYGIVLVAAAGNEGAPSLSYPAAYPEVIAVGAIDSNEAVPNWSNRNPDIVAPGVDILSTYPDDTYVTLSGTSMATPHVSGTVALIQAYALMNKGILLSPDEVRNVLTSTAKDLGAHGYDSLYGYGAINALAAIQSIA